jgi:thiamine kinase-like enzyme
MRYRIKKIIKNNHDIFGQEPVKIEKLPWGIWNFNFKVTIGKKKYVFKIFSNFKKYGYFANKGHKEYQTLKFLESINITPKTVLFDDSREILDNDVLVYEYVEGKWIKKDDIKKVAEILATLHSVKIEGIEFLDKKENSLIELFEEILKEFENYKTKDHKDDKIVYELEKFIKKLKMRSQKEIKYKPAIVHNDLVPSNIIKKREIKLIDWQGTWIGDPAFDCWAITSDIYNWWDWSDSLTDEQKETFWNKYLELTKDKNIRKRVEYKKPFYYMKLLLYSLNKFSDYKAAKLPEELSLREHHFRKYKVFAEMCLDNLRKLLD